MTFQKYDHRKVERKWQNVWEEEGVYKAIDNDRKRKKFYQLVEFPYPSGAGLHVGHVRSWASMDAYSRKKRMEGYNVLYPMGWDAFGLPAENYAIKTGIHPSVTVKENIKNFRKQCRNLGLSFDWSREIDTTDPKYYKWTQWIFIKLFKSGLAYREEVPVNWCPFCRTNLADEEVLADGKHERCGNPTEKRMQKQWLLRITEYADRLLSDLATVDFSPRIRIQQENWIGRKEGALIKFQISNIENKNDNLISIFTTRPDTIFGATFLAVSPIYANVYLLKYIPKEILDSATKYIKESLSKSSNDLPNTNEEKQSQSGLPGNLKDTEKTGVNTGLSVVNPATNISIPIFISDYVLDEYGTGAIMGVPAHDERDFAFAEKFELPVIEVIAGGEIQKEAYIGEGRIVNSGDWNGLKYPIDSNQILSDIEKKGWGIASSQYHLHDWIFSRQHYWGEPIPMIYCEKCAKEGKSYFTEKPINEKTIKEFNNSAISKLNNSPSIGWYPVSESDLPVELPFMEKYQPSGTGESPLANNRDFIRTKCPHCGSDARRETDTMPNWAGSNWYFIRYLDPDNDKKLADRQKLKYWMPVDFYQGGYEHTTLHLLYSRFIYKFLFDIGIVPALEPYAKRRSHGIVLGADGRKMSKSFGNVINPDTIVEKYGADTLRLYEMFMGPFDQMVAWSQESLEGCYRFINRLWRVFNEDIGGKTSPDLYIKLNKTIKKVSEDLENLKFNTAVASMMEFLNAWDDGGSLAKDDAMKFCRLIAPFTPHLAEEVWSIINGKSLSVHRQSWPSFNPKLIVDDKITIPVQVNGKFRGTIEIDRKKEGDKEYISNLAKTDTKISKWIEEKEIKKEIYVPGRLVNFVV